MAPDHEQRAEQRRKVLKRARLLIGPPIGPIDATIRDVSSSGMRLELPLAMKLPQQFRMLLLSEEKHHEAELRWQKGKIIGVKLVTPKAP